MLGPGSSTAAIANASLCNKSIHSTYRTGYFLADDTGANVGTNEWQNSQSGNTGVGFRRMGGVVHNDTAPHNWEYDGTNDKLGPGGGAGYGGDPFQINLATYWTIGIWWRYDASGNNYCWVFGSYNSGGAALWINSSSGKPEFRANSTSAQITSSYALTNHKWYYIAIASSPNNPTFDGDIDCNMYVFGVDSPGFVGSGIDIGGGGVTNGNQSMEIGYTNGATTAYTVADSRSGDMHAYVHSSNSSAKLVESQLRQNFEVNQDMIDVRLYGRDYDAISG